MFNYGLIEYGPQYVDEIVKTDNLELFKINVDWIMSSTPKFSVRAVKHSSVNILKYLYSYKKHRGEIIKNQPRKL